MFELFFVGKIIIFFVKNSTAPPFKRSQVEKTTNSQVTFKKFQNFKAFLKF